MTDAADNVNDSPPSYLSFGRLPLSAIQDKRLSKRDLIVLAVLYGHDMKGTGRVHPKRQTLSRLAGLPEKRISEATTRLQAFGYVVKEGRGGFSRPSTYTLTVPLLGTVVPQETVPGLGTVVTTTLPGLGTRTVPDSGRGNKERIEEIKKTHGGSPYSDDFEKAWQTFPKRSPNKGDKKKAYRAWNTRIAEGHTVAEMTEGLKRYSDYCDAEGKTGGPYVMHVATFFGPAEPPNFVQPWDSTKPKRKPSDDFTQTDYGKLHQPGWAETA